MSSARGVWAKRLQEIRLQRGLSQRQLGIEAGIDPGVASVRINRYERGVHEPDAQTARKLAQVLQVPWAYFLAEDDALAAWILAFEVVSEELKQEVLSKVSG